MTKRHNKENIKQQLIDSLVNNDTIETGELKQEANRVKKLEDAAGIIKQYEEILRTKRKGIISVAYIKGECLDAFTKRKCL